MTTAAPSLNAKAQLLRSYHCGDALVLPNVWDAASAALFAAAGAKAIATTSGGVSWALGRPDGQGLSRAEMLAMAQRIAATVDVPVTADIEGGYGATPQDVTDTVDAAVAAGVAGINLEDSGAVDSPLFSVQAQSARIGAAREAAAQGGVQDLVINVRTDVFLFEVGDPSGRFDEVIGRARAYAEAGADCLFVPGLVDLTVLKLLVDASPLPVNAMTGPGGPSVADLSAVGVQRISVGTAIAEIAYAAAQTAARELLSDPGEIRPAAHPLTYTDINGLFA
ncbi:isocitrate lyase/phosphoenolpyruvate mutase family protein [Streptomyces sp. CBMA152]|uniref:isocitrate lyase/PEP mutase family protein n=1 Tax=Streptomyces sp. CBMA152 TaxID=1896312 RepID=UPI00166037D6|nr:isocitrate lyase/phosphoenolpyruvate mutase family protein [Streptomyces sp. CBMA152]MBD0743147.1 3-methyl-2-oxobutanoate hydroxymethyltransferase [Streptomyces sp. CBMA152]